MLLKDKGSCGIILPIGRLSEYGFDRGALGFIDFLAETGQRFWQTGPLCPCTDEAPPFLAQSVFALDPALLGDGTGTGQTEDGAFGDFCRENFSWLEPYALFTALRAQQNGKPFYRWEEPLKMGEPEALQAFARENRDRLFRIKREQFRCRRAWSAIRNYAANKGVGIIGEIPFYPAFDSCDVWAHRELFKVGKDFTPLKTAGAPPEEPTGTGRLFGTPVYDFAAHRRDGYLWWSKRLAHAFSLFDLVQINGFLQFESYYSVSYGAATATRGVWEKGPGMEMIGRLRANFAEFPLIISLPETEEHGDRKKMKKSGLPYLIDADRAESLSGRALGRNCILSVKPTPRQEDAEGEKLSENIKIKRAIRSPAKTVMVAIDCYTDGCIGDGLKEKIIALTSRRQA